MKSLVALLALSVVLIVRLYRRVNASIEHNPPRELQPVRIRITRK